MVSVSGCAPWFRLLLTFAMKTDRKIAIGIFCVAALVRFIYLYENASSPYFDVPVLDGVYLDNLGLKIAHGGGFEDKAFFRAPLYPLVLGALYSISEADRFFLVRVFQHLLGALVCVMMFVTAREAFGRRAGIIAGLVAAFYGPLIFYEGEILIDSFFLFLVMAAVCLLVLAVGRQKRGHLLLGGGLALGLAAVTRANILPFVPVAALWGLFLPGKPGAARRLCRAGLILLPVAVILGMMALRNYRATGAPSMMPAQGGINFYYGNGPGADGKPPPVRKIYGFSGAYRDKVEVASVELLESAAQRPFSPTEVSSAWYGITFRYIEKNKATWLRLMFRKFVLFWNDYEIKNMKDWYFCKRYSVLLTILPVGYGVVAALGLLGIVVVIARKRSLVALLPVLYVLSFMATIMLFFVCGRLRLPVVVGLIPLAGVAADHLLERWKGAVRGKAAAVTGLCALLVFTYVDWYGARSTEYSQEFWSVGRIYYDRGEYGKAIDAIESSIAHDPVFPGGYLFLGHSLLQAGRYPDAIKCYRMALDRDTKNVRALNGVGVCEEKRGNLKMAIENYQQAAKLDPAYAKARTNLGILLIKRGKPDEGKKWLEESLALDGRDPETHLGLALCAAISGNTGESSLQLDAAVRLGGDQYRRFFKEALAEVSTTAR